MKDNKISTIIKEYYSVISPLLGFNSNSKTNDVERRVLILLCESKNCSDGLEGCWELINSAKCLQAYTDGALLQTTETTERNVAYDIKMDALTNNRISKLKNFDEITFVDELKTNANAGDKNSCKLLAYLNWLGLIVSQNNSTAQNIWLSLAMSGDWHGLEMLIYSYIQTGDDIAKNKWINIRDILKNEFESFSPVAMYSNYPNCSDEEIQTANIIMFISQKESEKGRLNRPMIYYALNSKDDYSTKMSKLSTDTNFYLALHTEDKFLKKKYGF